MGLIQVHALYEMGSAHAVYGCTTAQITGFSYDSRTCAPGLAFVGVRGESCNGSDHALNALKQGATAVVIDRSPTEEELHFAVKHHRGIIEAPDVHAFLTAYIKGRLAALRAPVVVGVTGSHGKTSTKELIASVLRQRYKTHATYGNLNSLYGLAHTLLTADDDVEMLVLEMGMDRLGEIADQAHLVRPTIGVLTNVSAAHINTLGSIENIAQAKFELLANLCSNETAQLNSVALLPQNSPFSEQMITDLQAREISYVLVDQTQTPHLRMQDAHLNDLGCAQAVLVDADGNRADVQLHLLGMYNLNNAVFAAEVGHILGIPLPAIAQGLASVHPPAMRGQTYQTEDGITLIDDSYNANPVSMEAMLTMFGARKVTGRRIAVLGEMKGLGDAQTTFDEHARIGALIAQQHLADYLIAVGAVSQAYEQGAQSAGMDPAHIISTASAEEAVEVLGQLAQPHDCIIAKASRSERLDRVIAAMKGGASC